MVDGGTADAGVAGMDAIYHRPDRDVPWRGVSMSAESHQPAGLGAAKGAGAVVAVVAIAASGYKAQCR